MGLNLAKKSDLYVLPRVISILLLSVTKLLALSIDLILLMLIINDLWTLAKSFVGRDFSTFINVVYW